MFSPSRLWPALLLPLLLAGCGNLKLSGDSADSKTLQPIRYYYLDINNGFDREMIIAPTGEVKIRETRGSAASDTRLISSNILDEERTALIAAFKGWDKLDRFYPTDVSPQLEISYGPHAVTTSRMDLMPPNYLQAKNQLDQIIIKIDKAANEKAAAATQPASTQSVAPPLTPEAPPIIRGQ
jgi:hypothetical protein